MKKFIQVNIDLETLELVKKLAALEHLKIYATIKKSLELLADNQELRQKFKGIKAKGKYISSKKAFWEWMLPNLPENEVKWYELYPEQFCKDERNYLWEYQKFKINYLQAQKQDAEIRKKQYWKDYYRRKKK